MKHLNRNILDCHGVKQGIRRYCKGMKAPNHAPVDVFDRFTDETGQTRYMLIGESLKKRTFVSITLLPEGGSLKLPQKIVQDIAIRK